jgi:hypothetical protein
MTSPNLEHHILLRVQSLRKRDYLNMTNMPAYALAALSSRVVRCVRANADVPPYDLQRPSEAMIRTGSSYETKALC